MQITRHNRRRLTQSLIVVFASFGGVIQNAHAIDTTWVGPASGDWNAPTNWNNGVPNSATFRALIDNGSAQNTSTSLETDQSIGTLTVSAGDRLSIPFGIAQVLLQVGTVNNAGTVSVDTSSISITSTANNSGTIIISSTQNSGQLFFSGTTLSGGGTLMLNKTGSFVPIVQGSGTFTNANNTIRGAALFGGNTIAIVNTGTIVAGTGLGTASLNIDPSNVGSSAFNNAGTLIASGEALELDGRLGGGFENTNGRIIAGTTDVRLLNNVTVNGGTWSSSGGGVVRVPSGHAAFASGFTNTGNITIDVSSLTFTGSIINSGSINLNAGTNNSNFRVTNTGSVTLGGGGIVQMATSGIGAPMISGSGTFTNLNNTIRGRGSISAFGLVNSGTIMADTAGATLTINTPFGSQLFTNTGTLIARNGGTLLLNGANGDTQSSTGAIIIADAASALVVSTTGRTLSAGTMTLNGTWSVVSGSTANVTHFRGTGTLGVGTNSTVRINAGGGTLGTCSLSSLSIVNGGKLNITDHDMILNYTGASPINTVRTLLQSGFGGGTFNGTVGIISSSAAASTLPKTAIGYAEASLILGPGGGPFSGLTADGTSVLLQYTVAGDANLDKTVNLDDFTSLASNFGGPAIWSGGDFNYDGVVNLDDFTTLAANFGRNLPADLPTDLPRGSAVPEPATLSMLAGAALLAGRRRRA